MPLTIARTAAASVRFPCRKRQLRPCVCSFEYPVRATIAALHHVTGRPGVFMSVIAKACGSDSATSPNIDSHAPADGADTPIADASASN